MGGLRIKQTRPFVCPIPISQEPEILVLETPGLGRRVGACLSLPPLGLDRSGERGLANGFRPNVRRFERIIDCGSVLVPKRGVAKSAGNRVPGVSSEKGGVIPFLPSCLFQCGWPILISLVNPPFLLRFGFFVSSLFLRDKNC